MTDTKVQRTFFVDAGVDAELTRMALKDGVSKNELTRSLLEDGMKPFLASRKLPAGLTHGSAFDAGEGLKKGMVMRSIYLSSKFDSVLRETAFAQKYSKSELMRHFIDKGLSELRKSVSSVASIGQKKPQATLAKRSRTRTAHSKEVRTTTAEASRVR